MSAPEPPPVPESRPPGALRSLGVGLRLAHANFLRLYPLALAVGVALELISLVSNTATVIAPFDRLPTWLFRALRHQRGVRHFIDVLLSTLGWMLPVALTTAVVAYAVRALVRGGNGRPFASLSRGARAIHIAIATAVAYSIVPVAAFWYPSTAGNDDAVAVMYMWFLPLSLPLATAVIARWLFAVPLAVLEKRGLIGAWRRSERLVVGRQLPTFGLVLVGIAASILAILAIRGVINSLDHQDPEVFPIWFRSPTGSDVALEFARVALAAWFHVCIATVTTVYFEQVRLAKEGPDADELQRVFN